MPKRFKLEATLNQEEERDVEDYCTKHNISRYTLIKRAVFTMIKGSNNRSMKEF